MPAEGRHRAVHARQSADLAQFQYEIEVECEGEGLVDSPHVFPRATPDQHARLRDQLRPPRQHSLGAFAGLVEPQFSTAGVDVTAPSVSQYGARVSIESRGRPAQRIRLEQIVITQPRHVLMCCGRGNPEVDSCRQSPRVVHDHSAG